MLQEDICSKRAFIVEILTPRGASPERAINLASKLWELKISALSVTDNPLGRARMSPWAVSALLEAKGVETLMHFTRISRNLLRIHSDLLGCWALGIKNLLILSGDNPKHGDYPESTVVDDITTVDLIRLVKSLNVGKDLKGRPVTPSTGFFVGAVFDPFSPPNVENALRKFDAGADFLISQPVFDAKSIEGVLLRLPADRVVVSLVLFRGRRHFEIFANVPGVLIPEGIKRGLSGRPDKEVRDASIEVAANVIHRLRGRVAGFYVIGVTKNTWELVGDLLSRVKW